MFEIKKILVPTDFSAPSNLALRYGHGLAQAMGAQLTVLHVADDPVLYAGTTSDEYRAQTMSDSDARLVKSIQEVLGDGEGIEIVSKCGSAATVIVEYAHDIKFDLIVMGSHGHSAMASMLLGNTAEHVVRHSPCPVMAVRSPEHDF